MRRAVYGDGIMFGQELRSRNACRQGWLGFLKVLVRLSCWGSFRDVSAATAAIAVTAVAHLVHLDVVTVEVEAGNPVLHVRLPPHRLRPQVEQLHVPVVVASGQAAVFVRVGVAERNGPAISCRLSVRNGQKTTDQEVTRKGLEETHVSTDRAHGAHDAGNSLPPSPTAACCALVET